jgi:hypothetical protein
VRAIGHRDGKQCRALAIGQRTDAVERLAQLLAALDLDLRADGKHAGRGRQSGPCRPQRVERLVVGDPVQPWAQIAHLGARAQRLPRAHEGRLQHVLGQRLGEQAPQVALQRPAVALDDLLEGTIVAGGGERAQAAVALRAQQRR